MKILIPNDKTNLLGNLSKKHKVNIRGYPVSVLIKKRYIRIIVASYINGEKPNIDHFFFDLKKEKRLINLERNGNFFLAEIKQDSSNKYLFQPGIFHIKAPQITSSGEYVFELASWEKSRLKKIIEAYKNLKVNLIYLMQKKINNIEIQKISPNLTDKQRKCLELAIRYNYYGYPRKIDLKTLAKKAGISYSTFQFHLRVAEKKIMPTINVNI